AVVCEALADLLRILDRLVFREPVLQREGPRERDDLLADQLLLLGEREVHRGLPTLSRRLRISRTCPAESPGSILVAWKRPRPSRITSAQSTISRAATSRSSARGSRGTCTSRPLPSPKRCGASSVKAMSRWRG